MSATRGRRAVVIGASMNGLLAARVASDHFEEVVLCERDAVTDAAEPRKGQPHARHLHGVLAQGLRIVEGLFPGLRDELVAAGATLADMGADIRWYAHGGYRRQFPSGMVGVMMTRALLEQQVRRAVLARPNVTLRSGVEVDGLCATADRTRVTGVRLTPFRGDGAIETLDADLVIDCGGRGSAAPRWLQALGYHPAPESVVTINVGYSTCTFRRRDGDLTGARLLLVGPEFPRVPRAGNVMPVEGQRWMCTLTGWGKDYPPVDHAGFMDFVRSLAAPDLAQLLAHAEPLSEVIPHRLPSNLRRHYERLSRFPAHYVVLGDAVCSFNPAYAQGMTSGAMQVQVLDDVLRAGPFGRATEGYFDRVADVVDRPWSIALLEDFEAPTTDGDRPSDHALLAGYVNRVQRATQRDPEVYRAFLDVMNLVEPGTHLMRPETMWRVLTARA